MASWIGLWTGDAKLTENYRNRCRQIPAISPFGHLQSLKDRNSQPVSFLWNPPSLGGVGAVQHTAVRSGAMLFPWYSTMMLTVESSCVIGLRVTKMARGGWEAYNEVVLVVSEKVDAAIEAHTTMLTGGSAALVVNRFREHVASNQKRLTLR
jgi:hypothetical protein